MKRLTPVVGQNHGEEGNGMLRFVQAGLFSRAATAVLFADLPSKTFKAYGVTKHFHRLTGFSPRASPMGARTETSTSTNAFDGDETHF